MALLWDSGILDPDVGAEDYDFFPHPRGTQWMFQGVDGPIVPSLGPSFAILLGFSIWFSCQTLQHFIVDTRYQSGGMAGVELDGLPSGPWVFWEQRRVSFGAGSHKVIEVACVRCPVMGTDRPEAGAGLDEFWEAQGRAPGDGGGNAVKSLIGKKNWSISFDIGNLLPLFFILEWKPPEGHVTPSQGPCPDSVAKEGKESQKELTTLHYQISKNINSKSEKGKGGILGELIKPHVLNDLLSDWSSFLELELREESSDLLESQMPLVILRSGTKVVKTILS
ncbi:hypothetical protein E5288_WYG001916 [Bos mutus]|uniref:Uncharacterized protein n=1 Tax=Bos mutus TaxID=72004 RepID=A0A6B0RJJ4_9CETA|nr:hypothetical protein [Bos mutus]